MKTEPIEFEVNGLTLRGNFYQAAEPKSLAVLFLHGWTGIPNEDAAKRMAENGYSCMTFSLSGHNNSDGKIEDQTRQKSLNEVLAAYDLFKSKLPFGKKIAVAGNSYGGYLAPILSAERPLAAIQMRVPANHPDEKFDQKQLGQSDLIRDWRKQALESNATKSLRALHEFNSPVQIIEAEHDELIDYQTVQNYANAVKDKSKLDYHFMKGWTHGLGTDSERNRQYQEILLNWLNGLT